MLWVCASAREAVAVKEYLAVHGVKPNVHCCERRRAGRFELPPRWSVVARVPDVGQERRLRAGLRCLRVPKEW